MRARVRVRVRVRVRQQAVHVKVGPEQRAKLLALYAEACAAWLGFRV